MSNETQSVVEVPIGSIANGHLTTSAYSSVFNTLLTALPQIRSEGRVRVNLDELEWIDHLPLLSLALLVDECAQICPDGCEVVLPSIPEREAFLERWGFLTLLDELEVGFESSDDVEPYEEAHHSRVLPIKRFVSMQGAGDVRDLLLKAEGKLLDVLRKQAFLEDGDVSALAELVMFELCKNVIEHSRSQRGGCAIAHASSPSARMSEVRNERAASWEKEFYAQIGDEGVTEIVLGDAGVGIIHSLQKKAKEMGASSAREILQHAFDPYSTSKETVGRKTRGLWCVKQKVRDLRGLLYVRTCSGASCTKALMGDQGASVTATPPAGVAAYWDFLNNPEQDKPLFIDDPSWFPGTQYQILLPQHSSHVRPKTYVALHTLDGVKKRVIPKPITLPKAPSSPQVEMAVRAAIKIMTEDEVLFIDMSPMGDEWDRETVGDLMKAVCDELVGGRQRRVWMLMLKPNEGIVEMMRVSTAVKDLWREQGIMIPVVKLKENLSLPPEVFPVLDDPKERSTDPGDTALARERLVDGVWAAVQQGSHPVHEIFKDLKRKERAWLEDTISRNFAIAVPRSRHGKAILFPEFAVYEVARIAGMLLLRSDLSRRLDQQIARRRQAGDRWYKLTSGVFCEEYIDEGIWLDMDAWLRNRIDCWIEEQVQALGPKYVVTYTQLGNALLARALQSQPGACHIFLGNYLDLHGPNGLEELDRLSKGDTVALLLDISGSGKTIEKLVDYIESRGATVQVINLIDTIDSGDLERRPRLSSLYQRGRVESLVSHPVKKLKAKPNMGPKSDWPVSRIDPVTLQPIPEVFPADKLMKDGEFWRLVARTGTLSASSISYKGHEFGSFILLTGLFNEQECVGKIAAHFQSCFDGQPPEVVLITEETGEFLPSGGALLHKLSVDFPEKVWVEGGGKELDEDDLLNKRVVIFTGAATSGSGIARLMKRCGLASKVHICVFIDRMSSDIASTFVQKHNATFKAFQRLRSGSPSLRHRSYHAAALSSLSKYRRSCLSNRLLLFVEEQVTAQQEMHTTVESPIELTESGDFLTHAFAANSINSDSNYDLTEPAGVAAMQEAIQAWESEEGLNILKAIVEEACCSYEAGEGEFAAPSYLEVVKGLYDAGSKGKLPDRMHELILTVMILERLPGERFQEGTVAETFYRQLWEEFTNAVVREKSERDAFTLAAVCLRCCAKLKPLLMLQSFDDVLRKSAQSRLTELTLAFELSKMRDEAQLSSRVIEALQQAAQKLMPDENPTSEVGVAFGDLLRDLGLAWDGKSVVAMQWSEIHKLLAIQPPDALRTVRGVIRTLRRIVPKSSIGYFQRMGGERYVLADAWPPLRDKAGSKFPTASKFVQKLIGMDGKFFTPDLSGERDDLLRKFYEGMCQKAEKHDSSWSCLFAELSAGDRAADKGNVLGVFRVMGVFEKGKAPSITQEQYEAVAAIVNNACALMGRPKATHVAKLGAWQFEHAVGGLGQGKPSVTGREATLQSLADLMLHLLGADLCRVAVHDTEERKWKSGPLSGRHWTGSREDLNIPDTDQDSNTVRAAKEGKPIVISDVHGSPHAPNKWVHGCIALPLAREGSTCETVVTLWHHVPGWFSQFDSVLLESLVAIGGARLFAVESLESQKVQEEGYFIKAVALHIGHTLNNLLQETDFIDLVQKVPNELSKQANECLKQVRDTHRLRARFDLLARMDEFLPDNRYSPNALYDQLIVTLHEGASAKNLNVGLCKLETIDGTVDCNLAALQDDLMELVVNSSKHGKGKNKADVSRVVKISLTIRAASAEDIAMSKYLSGLEAQRPFAILEYSDTGVGIRLEEKKNIFERKRWKIAAAGKSKSVGLGMPLARSLARKLGGDLLECGQYGSGARFLLFLVRNT